MTRATLAGAAFGLVLVGGPATAETADPLPSWNDGSARRAVIAFVEAVTREGGPGYVPSAAVFDNDGTLWAGESSSFGRGPNGSTGSRPSR